MNEPGKFNRSAKHLGR